MKFGPATKFNKRNKTMSKNFDNDIMLANCEVIAIFPIYGQFRAIQKLDSEHIVYKTYLLITSNLLSCKNWKQK